MKINKSVVIRLICLICVLSTHTACTTTHYIPIETIRTDSIYFSRLQRDSIFLRDSIYVEAKGDTVSVIKDRFIYHYKTNTDTVFTERVDTVSVIAPAEQKSPNSLPLRTVILILWALIAIPYLIYRLKKN